MYNIGSKFDGGAYDYKSCQRLPLTVNLVNLRSQLVDWRSVKLQPRSSVTIAKAAVSPTRRLLLWQSLAMAVLCYSRTKPNGIEVSQQKFFVWTLWHNGIPIISTFQWPPIHPVSLTIAMVTTNYKNLLQNVRWDKNKIWWSHDHQDKHPHTPLYNSADCYMLLNRCTDSWTDHSRSNEQIYIAKTNRS